MFITVSITAFAQATVQEIEIFSNAMHKSSRCAVIRPETTDSLAVVYLLHGYSGNFSNWPAKVPELKQWAERYRIMIVCPDGGFSSWYFDSPVDSSLRYETYISTEVPDYIDQHYATLRNRKSRAITGLSMGGHGAMFIAFRHADHFGATGSMSGGVDVSAIKGKYDIWKRLGDTTRLAARYAEYSVIGAVSKKPAAPLAIIFDCGMSDDFFAMNQALHKKLQQLNIAHDCIERPGKHDWDYWKNSVQYQLLFFSNYFKEASTAK